MKSKSNILPACICRFALALVLAVFFCNQADAVDITLAWDPNDEPDLGGYIVYYNIKSPGPPYQYSKDIAEKDLDDPLNPMATLTDLQDNQKYYVALTAYDAEGNESQYSNDVCFQTIDSEISVCSSSTTSRSGFDGGGGGGSGGSCFISTILP